MCPAVHSVVLQRMELKLGRVVGDRCPRGMGNFSKQPYQRSSRGQSALEMPYNYQIWSAEFVTRA